MPDNFDFATESSDLLERALKAFAEWAAQNWTMTATEAETLTDSTVAPSEYARGYNDAMKAIPDALAIWLGEYY